MYTIGLVLTPRVGVTQVSGLNFNSLARLQDGSIVGAKSDGSYILDSGGSDAGTNIDAFFEFPRTDFGAANQKRLRKAVIGMEADGLQIFKVKDDEGSYVSRDVLLPIDSQKSEGLVVPLGRSQKGRYFTIRWENFMGSDFSVDAIDLLVTLLAKKVGRSRYFRPYVATTLPMFTISASGS